MARSGSEFLINQTREEIVICSIVRKGDRWCSRSVDHTSAIVASDRVLHIALVEGKLLKRQIISTLFVIFKFGEDYSI